MVEAMVITGHPTGELYLAPIKVNDDYRKKWNIHSTDFVCLTKDGALISDKLYRVGGFKPNIKDDYFLIIKHVEAFYDDDITRVKKEKAHLEGRWCILDKNGVEKVEFPSYKSPYLVTDSCMYTLDNKCYNIETGECYGDSNNKLQSKDYVFLENKFDDDKSKRGVKKINKKDGSWELFKL